jgi:hypothetical protein
MIPIVLQNVIRLVPDDPGCSHIANKHYCDIDPHRLTIRILDETLTDGSGSQGIVAYIATNTSPREPSPRYVYSYSMFAKNAESPKRGRLTQPTAAALCEVPRIPAPIAAIATDLDVTLLHRTRQRNECPQYPIYRKQAPTITMTKPRL